MLQKFQIRITLDTVKLKAYTLVVKADCQMFLTICHGDNSIKAIHSIGDFVPLFTTIDTYLDNELYVFKGDRSKQWDPAPVKGLLADFMPK